MIADVATQSGTIPLEYILDIQAKVPVEWEEDGNPTGWNHKSDSITYSNVQVPFPGQLAIISLSFKKDYPITVDGADMSLQDAARSLGMDTIKGLLNPQLYMDSLNKLFNDQIENLDPPDNSPDY